MMLSMLHAPVGVLFSGSMHGTHSSPAPHVSGLRRLSCELPETRVMHLLRHTPWSVHVSSLVVQSVGTYSLPAWMIVSGTHSAALAASPHVTNALARDAGSAVGGTQCDGP